MTPQDLLDHYGGLSQAADALGITRQSVHCWKVNGYIPFNTQYRIKDLTGGKLKADREPRAINLV